MDIVYTLKDSSTNEEFIYSLRSLINIPHDRVYVIGGMPYNINLNLVTYIPTTKLKTKYKTTTNNLFVAANLEELSDDFIWMNDDFYIMDTIRNPKEELALNYGSVKDVVKRYINRLGRVSSYINGALTTHDYLNSLGIQDPLSYELHIPIVYNKQYVRDMFSLPGILDLPVLHKRTVYGNLYIKNSTYSDDVKVLYKDKHILQNIAQYKFLSSSDITWKYVKPWLSARFNKKCKYEM